ncbi:MAG: ATP-binding cassette domain-containing protein, partial [SAR324 cluster bacterium]|nr:ATP-binding cassette domain-containing protein [SAR324 cluster bacterium]
SLRLEIGAGAVSVARTVTLDVPEGRLPTVGVALQLPAGVPLPAGAEPLLLPAGAAGQLGLLLTHLGEGSQTLRVTIGSEGPLYVGELPRSRRVQRSVKLSVPGERFLVLVPLRVSRAKTRDGAQGGAPPHTPVQARLHWEVSGEGIEPLQGSLEVRVAPAGALLDGLHAERTRLPVDGEGRPQATRPADRIVLDPPWFGLFGEWLGWWRPADPLQPAAFARPTLRNENGGGLLVLARSYVTREGEREALGAFGNPALLGDAAAAGLVRLPAQGRTELVHPLFLDERGAGAGRYRYCTTWSLWGAAGEAISHCQAFRVSRSPLLGWAAIWGLTGLSLLAVGWAFFRMSRWLSRFAVRDLVLIALTAGLAFVAVSLPYAVVHPAASLVAGPFVFLVEGLWFKALLFLLLGSLFALVPRPGVYLLFYLLWMTIQAAINAHYTPQVVLFAGAAVVTIESGLWIAGITRRGNPMGRGAPMGPGGRPAGGIAGRLAAAAVVGLCEAGVVFWHLQLIKVLYRVYFADWYVLLQSVSEGVYTALGLATGLGLGAWLGRMQRPPLPDGEPSAHPGETALTAHATAPAPTHATALGTGPLLSVRGLTFTYPGAGRPALRDISLDIEPGEIVLLAGDSGCGKTTLLRAIQGVLPLPEGARIAYRGRPARSFGAREWAANCGLLFQEPQLQVIRRTIGGEVAFGLELLDGSAPAPAEAAHRIRTGLEFFGLGDLAGRSTAAVSGGELQRTALAALLAVGPRLLLLDEPLAHLDAAGRTLLVERLAALARKRMAVLVVEHRTEPFLAVARRVAYLEAGRIAWQGSPDEFRRTGYAASALPRIRSAARRDAPSDPAKDGRPPLARLCGVTARHRGAAAPVFPPLEGSLAAGQAVVLTGANGAGKSTLLELLAGVRRCA